MSGRYGSGLQPLRGQNNVQGGGDMGAIPNRLPGFQDILDPETRAEVRGRLGHRHPAALRAEPDRDVRGHGGGRAASAVYCIGENPAQSEADSGQAVERLRALDHLVVQDIFLTKTAELADVVLPATAGVVPRRTARRPTASGGCSAYARPSRRPARPARTSTSSATSPHGSATTGSTRTPRPSGTSCGRSPPTTTGMTYERLEEHQGIQWPCPEHGPARTDLPARAVVGRRTRTGAAGSRPSGSSSTTRRST